jgi:uncharacterized RDD family membrane protein YckC
LADDYVCVPSAFEGHGESAAIENPGVPPVEGDSECDSTNDSSEEPSTPWRDEIAARLNRYQSKRKPRPPRYPSLRLRFEEEALPRQSENAFSEPTPFPQSFATNHALALDHFAESPAPAAEMQDPQPSSAADRTQSDRTEADRTQTLCYHEAAVISVPAKILEFPRPWTPPPAPPDELAEPVIDRPRILDVPDVAVPAPALGGITIDPILQPEVEKRPGIDIPLQSAALGRRIFSAAIDDLIIASACAVFALIFWKMTAIQPPRLELLGMTAGLAAVLWAAYQYLLVVYSGSTPGLRLAKLELARFDGTPASRRLRRWRVLASFLSAVSLGMGYAWVFLDEDALCWHDRITHTYLAPRHGQRRELPASDPNDLY